jgi:S-(hydroxymethyl)glutathione dehydrogenase/alcohol dehydrogenase
MKAAVFHKPGDITYDTVEDPRIEQDTDVILKVTSTAICGSDLHILSGGVPQPKPMVMGHEFMGIVEEVGKGVKNLKKGDRVVVPFPIACGHCFFASMKPRPPVKTPIMNITAPTAICWTSKARPYSVIPTCMAVIPAARQNMCVPYADISPRIVPENMTDEQVFVPDRYFSYGLVGYRLGAAERRRSGRHLWLRPGWFNGAKSGLDEWREPCYRYRPA